MYRCRLALVLLVAISLSGCELLDIISVPPNGGGGGGGDGQTSDCLTSPDPAKSQEIAATLTKLNDPRLKLDAATLYGIYNGLSVVIEQDTSLDTTRKFYELQDKARTNAGIEGGRYVDFATVCGTYVNEKVKGDPATMRKAAADAYKTVAAGCCIAAKKIGSTLSQ